MVHGGAEMIILPHLLYPRCPPSPPESKLLCAGGDVLPCQMAGSSQELMGGECAADCAGAPCDLRPIGQDRDTVCYYTNGAAALVDFEARLQNAPFNPADAFMKPPPQPQPQPSSVTEHSTQPSSRRVQETKVGLGSSQAATQPMAKPEKQASVGKAVEEAPQEEEEEEEAYIVGKILNSREMEVGSAWCMVLHG